ncbi:MAG: RNase adaptor protein RapZ [Bacillus thermozeamaize]|uniref:RNase adaptor protein RapZ n=1 Tax=Bacillus thermozeamaize TaxID=230954 RepID=A0A1Y3PPJ3_9BACI|nr:MAG: RNase adaptor protein RapZ [Bacillus thermozeamaize]
MQTVELVIVTGMSGAGKTVAVQSLEDLGFFCVDNLPPVLIPKFAEILQQSGGKIGKAALVIDLRGGEFFSALSEALDVLKQMDYLRLQILFLDADDQTLVRRYKETRRRHPLAAAGSPLEGIQLERKKLQAIKEQAHLIIDTSRLKPRELRDKLASILISREEERLAIHVLSFGFKFGVPMDADLVFDVRFLPNPYYEESLRALSGKDEPVYRFVMESEGVDAYLGRLSDFLLYLLPLYAREGKSQLVIGIGCTGGRHRSVAIAEYIGKLLRERHYDARVEHRDIHKDVLKEG